MERKLNNNKTSIQSTSKVQKDH